MKDKILSISFISLLTLFLVSSIVLKDKDISFLERRKLTSFPELKINYILDGSFFENFNDYAVDQFPLRDSFRRIKGIFSNKFLNKKDENGTFIIEDNIYQLNDNLNEKSINHITDLINKVKTDYIKSNKIYYSIIPDKNYYLNDSNIPKLDYNQIETIFKEKLQDMKYIDIKNELTLDSYYKTDIHWKQENLDSVVKQLSINMGLELNSIEYSKEEYYPFYGALYGRIASNIKPDKITYLTNNDISNASVYNYEKNKHTTVYDEKNLKNIDSYDIYLDGATPLLIIENDNNKSGKELIIFRDSFGSSLAPLLISSYSKITIIDLRYISSSLIKNIEEISFNENQDILFIYSIPIINNSFTLK